MTIWYRCGNHLIGLPLNETRALSMLQAIFEAGYTQGQLGSSGSDFTQVCPASSDWQEFEPRARQWLQQAQRQHQWLITLLRNSHHTI